MEYLLVEYPRKRRVMLKDDVIGFTNEVIEIEGGAYTITLGGDPNYAPAFRKVNISNTSVLDPKTTSFTPAS